MKKTVTAEDIKKGNGIKIDELVDQDVAVGDVIKNTTAKKSEVVEDAVEEKADNELKAKDVEAWRSEFKKIFKTTIDDHTFIWRKLRRHEYIDIYGQPYEVTPKQATLMMEEDVVKVCVLFPYDMDDIIEETAGIASNLSDVIMEKSGFGRTYTDEV